MPAMQAFYATDNRMVEIGGFVEGISESRGLFTSDELGVVEVELHPRPRIISVCSQWASPIDESFVFGEGVDDKNILKAVFVVGSSGSGKTTVASRILSGTGMKFINQDKHLEMMLRKATGSVRDAGALGFAAVGKARDISDKERDQFARRRLGLVIDATGWSYDRIATPNTMLRSLGYDTFMVLVDVPLDTARKRNEGRGAAGGRLVPDSFLKDAFVGLNLNRKKYAKLFGANFYVIDNSKDRSPADWENTVGRYADKIARAILSQSVKNTKGKAWLSGSKSDGYAKPKKMKGQPASTRIKYNESFYDPMRDAVILDGLPEDTQAAFDSLCEMADGTGCRIFDNPLALPVVDALIESGTLIREGDFLTFARVKYENPSMLGLLTGE